MSGAKMLKPMQNRSPKVLGDGAVMVRSPLVTAPLGFGRSGSEILAQSKQMQSRAKKSLSESRPLDGNNASTSHFVDELDRDNDGRPDGMERSQEVAERIQVEDATPVKHEHKLTAHLEYLLETAERGEQMGMEALGL